MREGYTLEFKTTVDPNDRAELAKDVALLANMYGGLLLVGAAETPAGVEYPGLPAAFAKTVQEAYTLAVRDFCSPRPIFALREIVNPKTRDVVVALNVEPFPDQPVGAATANKQGKPSDAWRFPIRVRNHTLFASPDKLMLWFNPQTRRTAIGLSQIPDGSVVRYFCQGSSPNSGVHTGGATLQTWSVSENFVQLKPDRLQFSSFRAPLEDVASISKSIEGLWQVRLRGCMQRIDGPEGTPIFGYHPA
ncbi:MAG TPA: ATP-binding protein [Polyangiaceae bacterium]|nr:ATP-binding protein [Polyangiaceae bacterium]